MNLNIETVTHDEYYEVIGGELDVYTVPELKKFDANASRRYS